MAVWCSKIGGASAQEAQNAGLSVSDVGVRPKPPKARDVGSCQNRGSNANFLEQLKQAGCDNKIMVFVTSVTAWVWDTEKIRAARACCGQGKKPHGLHIFKGWYSLKWRQTFGQGGLQEAWTCPEVPLGL